ncbi:hypothetical protein [Desulfatitalea alkaliphila]|uniref:AbiU2 domain-containing protein n=1 Tax=Desulfatitalea alkaliphila TaxID=2929485 RepID=UPI003CCFC48F
MSDLKKFKSQLTPSRKLCDEAYRNIRSSVFAHILVKKDESVSGLYGKTNISDIKQILYSLKDILEALWQLLHNGRKLEFGNTSKDYEERIEKTTCSVLSRLLSKKIA